MMKRIAISLLAAATLCGCAKSPISGDNDASKKYFEAFISTNYPGATKTALGSYIISSDNGNGEAVGDIEKSPFVLVDYVSYDLSMNVVSTTDLATALKVGLAGEGSTAHYGPVIWDRRDKGLTVGLEEIVKSMRVGGTVTAAIPGWLVSFEQYANAADYEKKSTTSSSSIYNLKLLEAIKDINQWEIDSLDRYFQHNYPEIHRADSLQLGLYYKTTRTPSSQEKYKADSTFKINYIGRLLDGTVFDTNIKDTAKFYGIYKASTEYAPKQIKMSDEYTEITFAGGSAINGFARALAEMKENEACTVFFTSNWGYGPTGSGTSIPAYSPLRFDIDIVEDEDDSADN